MSFEEYGELAGVGFQGAPESVPPEEEFFKSIYIAGVTRKNHINVEEKAGKLQIRGLEYNLDKVCMVITHTKEILVREPEKGTRALFSCFSFKDGQPPWHGTSKLPDDRFRVCPSTSAERAVNDYCAPCRGQILVAGICCKADGSPLTDGNGKPVFVFLRGRGTKYGNISSYLGEMFKLDLSPIFEPVTEQSQAFEKAVVNNKRFVTEITVGQADTRFGPKNVFVLNKGTELAKESVMNILSVSKKTLEKFNDKFDWSKRAKAAAAPPADGILTMDEDPEDETTEAAAPEEKKEDTAKKTFSFDNIEF
jgi:hypothetical protein